VVGSMASLAANVAVAEASVTGRAIAAWPSFALIAAYELLMRQVRRAASGDRWRKTSHGLRSSGNPETGSGRTCGSVPSGRHLHWQAWEWAQANRASDGSLPSGKRSPASMAATSGGDAWLRAQDALANLMPTTAWAGARQAADPASVWPSRGSQVR
jgi:hypothetical protein